MNLENQKAHQSIAYNPEEHIYDHDLSIQSIGRKYTSMKLKEHIDLDMYLNYPPDITDDLIQGIMMGLDDREKLEEEAARQEANRLALEKEKAAQNMNQLHNDKEN